VGRDYGAALRLSICRELARSLGGELEAVKDPTGGERLVLRLPNQPEAAAAERRGGASVDAVTMAIEARRDRDPVVLVAEGNAQVASVLLDIVRANGYEGVVATDQRSLRLLVREMAPEAVIFGASLGDVDAWTALAELRREPAKATPASVVYRDIDRYVCMEVGPPLGGGEDVVERIIAGLDAAAGRRVKRILATGASPQVAAEDIWSRQGRQLLIAADGRGALDALAEGGFDGLLLGPALAGMEPWALLRGVDPAVLDRADLAFAVAESDRSGSWSFGVLRQRTRLEYVLAEMALYLQRSIDRRPVSGRELTGRRRTAPELAGRKALIVDDDIYNIYAVTGAMEQQGMNVVLAENGREAVKLLRTDASVDVVLTDVTMPDVDGESLVRALRGASRPALPLIAVTPRAIPGDREKWIAAGASDYISKPVNLEQLLGLLRAWLGLRAGGTP
jgi:CheY-like chemotaxis protein